MRSSTASKLYDTPLNNVFYSMVPSSLAKNPSSSPGILHPEAFSPSLASVDLCHTSKKRTATPNNAGTGIEHVDLQASKKRFISKLPPSPSQSPRNVTPFMSPCLRPVYTFNTPPTDSSKSKLVASPKADAHTAIATSPQVSGDENPERAIVSTTTQQRSCSTPSSSLSTPRRRGRTSTSNIPADTPKPIQFINNVAPVVPRPKPAVGTYVQTQSAIQQKARKKQRDEGKTKRPSNCFIKYRTGMHPLIVAHYGNQNNKEISKLAGQCWREEPEWVKSFYRQQALDEKQQLKALHPEYKYNPARSGYSKGKNGKSGVCASKDHADSSSSTESLPTPRDTPGSEDNVSVGDRTMDTNQRSDPGGRGASKSLNKDVPGSKHSNPSKAKYDKERRFVVTETALHEFMGDSDPVAKKPISSKNRTSGRPSGSSNRNKSISVGPHLLAQHSTLLPNAELSKESTFVKQPPPTMMDLMPYSSLPGVLTDHQDWISSITASTPSSSASAASSAQQHLSPGSTLLPSNIWGLEEPELACNNSQDSSDTLVSEQGSIAMSMSDEIGSLFDAQAAFEMAIMTDKDLENTFTSFGAVATYSSQSSNGSDARLQVHCDPQQGLSLGLAATLNLPSTIPETVHRQPHPIHSALSSFPQQQQATSAICDPFDQDILWDLNVIPGSIVPAPDIQIDPPTETQPTEPGGTSSQHFSVAAILSVSPPTPMLTPNLITIDHIDNTNALLGFSSIMEPAHNAGLGLGPSLGPQAFGQEDGYQMMVDAASCTEWLTATHSSSVVPILEVNELIQQQHQQHQELMFIDLQLPPSQIYSSLLSSNSSVLGNNVSGIVCKNGQHIPAVSTSATVDYSGHGAIEWGVSSYIAPIPTASSTGLMSGIGLGPSPITVLQQQPQHGHSLMESGLNGCSVEELTMSIEYYERLIALQKMQLQDMTVRNDGCTY